LPFANILIYLGPAASWWYKQEVQWGSWCRSLGSIPRPACTISVRSSPSGSGASSAGGRSSSPAHEGPPPGEVALPRGGCAGRSVAATRRRRGGSAHSQADLREAVHFRHQQAARINWSPRSLTE